MPTLIHRASAKCPRCEREIIPERPVVRDFPPFPVVCPGCETQVIIISPYEQ